MNDNQGIFRATCVLAAFCCACILQPDDDDDGSGGGNPTSNSGTGDPSETAGTQDTSESATPESESTAADASSGGSDGSSSTGEAACDAEPVPCEDGSDDPAAAFAICDATPGFVSVTYMGSADGRGVRSGLGEATTHDPREGSMFAVIGSGFVEEIDGGAMDCDQDLGDFDPLDTLPDPIVPDPVAGETSCLEDGALVGTGDCSRTIDGQFSQGGSAFDFSGIQAEFVVPEGVNSLQFDVAFFSTEYPDFFGEEFNDMFVGWVESESWTGNVSFDQGGNPISLNAGFLDFRDDDLSVPEFEGTCFAGHGGTRWLTSTARAVPGETLTLVVAVFDLADSVVDSYAFLDNFRWSCDEPAGPLGEPHTEPN